MIKRLPLGGGVDILVDEMHTFGEDALLLAAFSRVRPGEKVGELGTGCGILPLLWCRDACQAFDPPLEALDCQAEAVSLLRRSLALNGLTGQVGVTQGDWNTPPAPLLPGRFDKIICNPPYFSAGSGGVSREPARRLCRHEGPDTLTQVTKAAARLLKNGGRFFLCHRPQRLCDVLLALRGQGLEPKRLVLVQNEKGREPWLLLCEAKKGGKPGLRLTVEAKEADGGQRFMYPWERFTYP